MNIRNQNIFKTLQLFQLYKASVKMCGIFIQRIMFFAIFDMSKSFVLLLQDKFKVVPMIYIVVLLYLQYLFILSRSVEK